MDSHQIDVRNLDNLFIPYNETVKPYLTAPHFTAGNDLMTNQSGTLRPRPGFLAMPDTSVYSVAGRIDRLITYETMDNPSHVYLVASVYFSGSSVWKAYYLKLDGSLGGAAVIGTWTSLGTSYGLAASTRVHEFQVARGNCYIKSFPVVGTDKYGSVVFNGASGNIQIDRWGIASPTQPARVTASGGWNAATNPVTVLYGWYYTYAWKSRTGNYSTRAPIESDPTHTLSTTGAFTNKKPTVTLRGNADTTSIPLVGVWRTTDGGGTFYWLEDVSNPGDSDFTYEDHHRVLTNTNDPQTDLQLDTTNIAPTLVSNMPPPPVDETHITGTDAIQPSINIAYWARRMWYGIHRVYYSGQEEISNGIPEECFPNPNGLPGLGNFYQFRNAPRLLQAAKNGLYCVTSEEIQRFTGQDLTNIRPDFVDNIGAFPGQTEAITTFQDSIFFVTRDNHIAMVTSNNPAVILSPPIAASLKTAINGVSTGNLNITMDIYNRDGNLWLIVNCARYDVIGSTRQFVFDINNNIWFTPWTAHISAIHYGLWKNSTTAPEFLATVWDGTNSSLVYMNQGAAADVDSNSFVPSFTLNMMTEPTGDHVNILRMPVHASTLEYVVFTGDLLSAGATEFLNLTYRLDSVNDSFSSSVTPVDPPYSNSTTRTVVMRWFPIQKSAYWFQIQVTFPSILGHIHNIGLAFQPESGA